MHATTLRALRTRRRWVFLGLLGALLLLVLAPAAPAFGASAPDFTGGPAAGDYPVYVPNDYSVNALRFTATGLQDGAGAPVTGVHDYYMKIRLSPIAGTNGVNNRGFTWNDQTHRWVQEREDWDQFPIVSTNASGAIATGNRWSFFRFGDTTKSGTYYLMVSLQPKDAPVGVGGTTQNSASKPAVTLLDMSGGIAGAVPGFRVHNGIAQGQASSRVEADESGLATVWALTRTETNGVDDNNDGTYDNEDYGPAGAAGDFSLGVPAGLALDVKIKNAIWPAAAGSYTGALADVDVAYGAADQTPPTAPTSLLATAGDTHVSLSWGAASDLTGVTAYQVFRWVDAPAGAGYTSPMELIATVDSGTTYDDTGLTNGTEYHYVVRAVDVATNVGPRSAQGDATPKAPAELTLETSARFVNWGGLASLTGELADGADPFTAGQAVRLEWSYDGATWTLLQPFDPTDFFAHGVPVSPTRKTQYRLVFEGDATHDAATSLPVTVKPRVKLGTPVAPRIAKKAKKFNVYGSLVPKHLSGGKYVVIKCYKKVSGAWHFKKSVSAPCRNYRTYSRYSARFSLGSKGSWKLLASYKATKKYAAKKSGVRYVKVN